MNARASLIPYHDDVYRVFSTAYPTQDLLDDLLDSPQEQDSLMPLYYSDKYPETMDRLERVLQRSTQEIIQTEISTKFQPQNWYKSRFSDGTWAVLYSAESSKTARAESFYHKRRFMKEELAKEPVQIDLREVQLDITSDKAIDLTQDKTLDHAKLTSQDESGYPYCQRLADGYRKADTQLLRAPSARDSGGICIPIFDRSIIKKDTGHLKYLKCVLYSDRTTIFTTEGTA